MTDETPTYDVVHEPDQGRFAVHAEGHSAVLEYQRFPDKVVFTHTGVPSQLGGRGVGGRLVRAGLDWARAEGLRVIPTCPFVTAYIGKHLEYADLTRR